uniref:Uncharacterized protein n=1 Tax=Rhipicephalus zambeziensis TaxID=60191 RepID=A0A224Y741_9ACAR
MPNRLLKKHNQVRSYRHSTHEWALLGKKIKIKKALVGDDVRFRYIVLIVSLLVYTRIISIFALFFFSSSLESDLYRKQIGMRTTESHPQHPLGATLPPASATPVAAMPFCTANAYIT